MKLLLPFLFLPFIAGCGILDFGGNDEKAFEFRFGFYKAPSGTPGTYDKDGNFIPSPEVAATYSFPDVTAAYLVTIRPEVRTTPAVGIELCEFKLWKLRWFNLQAQFGSDMAVLYLGKRITSILEITCGVFAGWDFQEKDFTWGVGGTLLKW